MFLDGPALGPSRTHNAADCGRIPNSAVQLDPLPFESLRRALELSFPSPFFQTTKIKRPLALDSSSRFERPSCGVWRPLDSAYIKLCPTTWRSRGYMIKPRCERRRE